MDEEESAPALLASVLIVSYNCADALRRCLTALEASENRATFEIIVVDCVSSDGSGQLDSEFPEISLLRLPRNLGRTRARNIGARTARADHLLLLDPSVEVQPATITALHEKFGEGSQLGLACPLLVNESGEVVSRAGALPEVSTLLAAWSAGRSWEEASLGDIPAGEDTLEVDCPDPRAVMMRTQSLRGMNYFDERYGEFGSDIELFTQVYRASKRAVVFRDVTAVVRDDTVLWSAQDEEQRTCLLADFGNGLAVYAGKHYGWFAGLRVRLRMIARALFGLRLGLLFGLLSGQIIDGTQREL